MSILSTPFFHDEAAAFDHLESVLWSDGAVCPHCGSRFDVTRCLDCGAVHPVHEWSVPVIAGTQRF